MDLEVVTLENGKEYYIVKEIKNYLYLVNVKNNKDVCIRKTLTFEGEDFIDTLSSKEEFNEAMALFKEE